MLTADQLDVLPNPILELFERYHTSILEDIARRLANLDYTSAAWQVQRLNEAGLLYAQILSRLSDLTGQSEDTLKTIFENAGVKAFAFDDRIYRAAGLNPLPLNLSPNVMEALTIGLQKTGGLLRNLTLTTAMSGYDVFIDASDLAYMQVSTGALDYNTAIREAVKSVAEKGLQVIYYDSGHRDQVDVAVRRAVLTGVSQTVGEMQLKRAEDMGSDLVQTSAHIGARNKGSVPENHELWQGRIFTLGTDPENANYPDFYAVTGYGTITGLMGINCRHSFFPFFKGISEAFYDEAGLTDLADRTVTYSGETISFYDATQIQRKLERAIRKAKRVAAPVAAAGLDNSQEIEAIYLAQAKMRDFIRQTGLTRQYQREQVDG